MGCHFYVQAEVPDTQNLIVDIGMGIFIEMNRKQTLNLCEQKVIASRYPFNSFINSLRYQNNPLDQNI